MNEEVLRYIQKSEHAITVAETLARDGFAPDAASKIYYAMFYAAQALLKHEGIEVVKHSAVESALGYYFVKTGRMDKRFHRMFIDARKIREIADYELDDEIIEPSASINIEQGKEFLTLIRKLLGII